MSKQITISKNPFNHDVTWNVSQDFKNIDEALDLFERFLRRAPSHPAPGEPCVSVLIETTEHGPNWKVAPSMSGALGLVSFVKELYIAQTMIEPLIKKMLSQRHVEIANSDHVNVLLRGR